MHKPFKCSEETKHDKVIKWNYYDSLCIFQWILHVLIYSTWRQCIPYIPTCFVYSDLLCIFQCILNMLVCSAHYNIFRISSALMPVLDISNGAHFFCYLLKQEVSHICLHTHRAKNGDYISHVCTGIYINEFNIFYWIFLYRQNWIKIRKSFAVSYI